MKLTTLTAFVCLLAVAACALESELDALFRQQKYEEFVAKVREVDPRRENRVLDEKMKIAIPLARLSRCNRERESLLATLADLDAKESYAEIKRLAGPCRDTDAKIAAFEKKAIQELDPATIFAKMSMSAHLAKARTLMQSPPNHEEARRHLAAITPSHKEYVEATQLLREISNREKAEKADLEATNKRHAIAARESLASELERRFLRQGWDVNVSLQTKDKTTLYLKYVLFSRPLVYNITNETDFLSELGKAGFKKVIFDDGYQSRWTYGL